MCGHCWNGNLAVAPDGKVFPCVMSRDWAVGDVLGQTLDEILHGDELARIRREIHDTVWREKTAPTLCPQTCVSDLSCPCEPLLCTQSCDPLPTVRDEWQSPTARFLRAGAGGEAATCVSRRRA
ncbi:SPASM domain-containing protein [Streptomyces fagopyri]|uniref:SPASM domain-containing protein n=1 Tax=Streptomyces fagopyri TaxID=2662397 RepID=UPI0033FDE691